MGKLPSLRYIRSLKNKWLACHNLHSLQHLLRLTARKLTWLENKKYTLFSIPKKDGSLRYIEDPDDRLKQFQRTVNDYLQAVYYFYRHPASYGFCIRVKKDPHPCTLFTHAQQHTGCTYLLNADLKDFFHSVTWQKVFDLFGRPPFKHDQETKTWLCQQLTYNGRLPMGAPTSPVLSNLAATPLDFAFEALARRHTCTYTRYADDLSFSSKHPLKKSFREEILQTIREHGFEPNLQKIKEFGPRDVKIVTGLQVTDRVHLGASFWQKTGMLLEQWKALLCLLNRRPSITVYNQAEDIKEKIKGFLAFASMIDGHDTKKAKKIQSRMDNMEEELEAFESLAWDEIPYQF